MNPGSRLPVVYGGTARTELPQHGFLGAPPSRYRGLWSDPASSSGVGLQLAPARGNHDHSAVKSDLIVRSEAQTGWLSPSSTTPRSVGQ
jgi:hypothetical protein